MTDEAARQALEHLQHAVLETIAAARSALDVAEDLVRDPAHLARLAAAAGAIADVVGQTLGDALSPKRPAGERQTGEDGRPRDEGDEPTHRPRVEHISVR